MFLPAPRATCWLCSVIVGEATSTSWGKKPILINSRGAGEPFWRVSSLSPSIGLGVNVAPTLGTVSIAGYDPVVAAAVNTTATLGTLSITGYDPTVTAPIGVQQTPVGALTITGFNPTVAAVSSTLVDLFFKFKDASGIVRTRQFWRRPVWVTVTSTYTASNIEENIAAGAAGGAFTITMPSAVNRNGYTYNIKKTDASANAVKVDGLAAQTIDGDADFDLEYEDEVITLSSDNANWQII